MNPNIANLNAEISVLSSDLEALKKGQPPQGEELLQAMTLGQKVWLAPFIQDCLINFIGQGGSKVKFLVGSAGTGKTHLLRCALLEARKLGFVVVELSARENLRLHKLVELYRTVAAAIPAAELVERLCQQIGQNLGYSDYDGKSPLLSRLYDQTDKAEAKRAIRQEIYALVRPLDIAPCFKAFTCSVLAYRMLDGREDLLEKALPWLAGEKLTRADAKELMLLTVLKEGNARSWLNSLLKLLVASGYRGLIVGVDDLEILATKDPEMQRYRYTPAAVQDIYETIRQILDDMDLMPNFGLLLAGDSILLEDQKRGLHSYDALWQRLQSGIVPDSRFNPLADMVDTDKHFTTANAHEENRLAEKIFIRLREILSTAKVEMTYQGLPDLSGQSELRAMVIEAVLGG
ncbi:MAG: BREX system ATP-binding domain-containing protein [Pseudanabaenaceae cyanobacterium]